MLKIQNILAILEKKIIANCIISNISLTNFGIETNVTQIKFNYMKKIFQLQMKLAHKCLYQLVQMAE